MIIFSLLHCLHFQRRFIYPNELRIQVAFGHLIDAFKLVHHNLEVALSQVVVLHALHLPDFSFDLPGLFLGASISS